VSFRSAATIAETCKSVATQDYSNVEHLIIDGASKDETCETARKCCRTGTLIFSEQDSGIYDAMNKGIRLATGDIIGFLNADDVYAHPSVLSRVAEIMADPTVDACFADVLYVDADDLNHPRRWWRSGQSRPSLISVGWIPAHPTFYARRSVYEKFGAFDLRFRLAADHECLSRLLYRNGVRAVYAKDVWVKMRLGGATNLNWKNILRQNYEILLGMCANRIPISPLLPIWKVLDRIRQRRNSHHLMQKMRQKSDG
jgi:glycosyltransferase involved in cell wall biosynthesis